VFFEVPKRQNSKNEDFFKKKREKWDKGSKIVWEIKSDQRQYLGTV
jgi:hypothetical protein